MAKRANTWAHLSTLLLGAGLASSASAWTNPAVPTPTLASCARATNSPAVVQPSFWGSATNRTNIQHALDSAATYQVPVVLASGTFNLQGSLNIPTGVTLCSQGGTTLKWLGASAPQTFVVQANGASNFRIANLNFDGAGIWVTGGSAAVIEANTFKNIKPSVLTDTQNVYGWMAIKLDHPTSLAIRQNVFDNIAAGAVAAWDLTGTTSAPSTITSNWFGHMNQAISTVNAQYTTVDSNQGYALERMGVEMIGTQLTGTPALDHPGIAVTNNRFGNWRRVNTASVCAGNADCIDRYGLMGISVVSSTSANVSNNVLDCGTGCVNADRGWGIEFSSYGTAKATRNTVRGFSIGIISHHGQNLSLTENALFEVNFGIQTTDRGNINNLSISGNQIEAAPSHFDSNSSRWGSGIYPDWNHAGTMNVSNNTVVYKTDASRAPVGGDYTGIHVVATRAAVTPSTISGNRLLIEGAPVAGFEVFGIRLWALNQGLSGTTVSGNWLVATGGSAVQQGTGLDDGGFDNGTSGVVLSGNIFQNLSRLNSYIPNHASNGDYTTSWNNSNQIPNLLPNLAINMNASAATRPDGTTPTLATGLSVALPVMSLTSTPAPTLGNTTATFSFTSSIGATTPAFAPFAWHYGDGRVATTVNSISGSYAPGASRLVRALAKDSNGALVTATQAITQQ